MGNSFSFLRLGSELKTFQNGEFVLVNVQSVEDWKNQGINNLNILFDSITSQTKTLTKGQKVGSGNINTVKIKKTGRKIIDMGVI